MSHQKNIKHPVIAVEQKTLPWTRVILVAGILLIACNLRTSITSVGPIVDDIRRSLHISNGLVGLITTLPLISFGLLSSVAPRIGRRIGNEQALFLGLITLLIGIVIRSIGSVWALFVGTALLGFGIAIGNVLLPSVIKHRFPDKVGLMTSSYSTVMGVFAATASGISVPLSRGLGLGWQKGLLVWGLLCAIACLCWLPQLRKHDKNNRASTVHSTVWSSGLAWQVTFFMGCQSFLFYCTIAWLPSLLLAHGISQVTSGWLVSIMQFVALPTTFATPILADKLRHQRGIIIIIGLMYAIGIVGLFFKGSFLLTILWVVLIGLAQGGCISLSLALFGLRTDNAHHAAELSGMAQSVGYLLAAVGPVLIGILFDLTHSWAMPLWTWFIVLILMILAGMGAGRNRVIH